MLLQLQPCDVLINPKKVSGIQFDPVSVCALIFKIMFSGEKVELCFFLTFVSIISHIFQENFTEIPQLVQKI